MKKEVKSPFKDAVPKERTQVTKPKQQEKQNIVNILLQP